MIRISIIIALYNGEKYIARCLKSILDCESQNIEIIIVNDGSTDNSLTICDSFAKRDSRIKIVTKVNEGVSAARNLGIQYAKGEYIWFVDADDWITKNAINYLLRMINIYKPDIFQFQLEQKEEFDIRYEELVEKKVEKITDVWESVFLNKVNLFACGGLIKKSIFIKNDIEFPLGRSFEDMDTIYKLLLRANHIYVDSNILYCYYNNPDSATHTLTINKVNDLIYALNDIEQDFTTTNSVKNENNLFYTYMINNYIQALVFALKNNNCSRIEVYCKSKIKQFEKNTSVIEMKRYCSNCRYSMFKYFIFYKIGLLKFIIRISK